MIRDLQPMVVISDLLGDHDTLSALHALQAPRLDVIVIQILADEELNPTLNGVLRLIDAESTQALKTTVEEELLQLYRTQCQSHPLGLPGNHKTPIRRLLFLHRPNALCASPTRLRQAQRNTRKSCPPEIPTFPNVRQGC